MIFSPYVLTPENMIIPVEIHQMQRRDAQETIADPIWQSDWTNDYIKQSTYLKYAFHTLDHELVALGMYDILDRALVVRIVYMEAHPESNPTIARDSRKYNGIGKLLIAFGIKLSIDNGFGGDVILEAKTDALADHYKNDFGGIELPSFGSSSAPRFLIQGEAAKNIFFSFLK